MTEPIQLRVHHLLDIKRIALHGFSNFADGMYFGDYVNSRADPAVGTIYDNIVRLMTENPDAGIELVVGRPDFICGQCPKYERGVCEPENVMGKRTDLSAALSFKIDFSKDGKLTRKDYTVRELAEIMGIAGKLKKQ